MNMSNDYKIFKQNRQDLQDDLNCLQIIQLSTCKMISSLRILPQKGTKFTKRIFGRCSLVIYIVFEIFKNLINEKYIVY